MGAATVTIAESNGTTPTVTASITNTNMGSSDTVNLTVSTSTAITAGTNSFEKWQRFNVSTNADGNTIKNLQVWASEALNTGATHKTNARTTSYGGAQTFDTVNGPLATDRSATYGYTQTMPTSNPGAANLGIGGSLTGEITTTGYSDYLVMQIQTTGAAIAGKTVTMNYQYDEYA
jgi:hypothetical protein